MDEKNDVKNDIQLEETEPIMTEDEAEESWLKKHKKKIIGGLGTAVLVFGGLFAYKNKDTIKGKFNGMKPMLDDIDTAKIVDKAVETVTKAKSVIPDNFKLTGNRYTARELGSKMHCSDREINKRIIRAGLAERLCDGELCFTDVGRGLGESKWKVTKAGHSFSNIEWDEAILDIIFTAEERAAVAASNREVADFFASKMQK